MTFHPQNYKFRRMDRRRPQHTVVQAPTGPDPSGASQRAVVERFRTRREMCDAIEDYTKYQGLAKAGVAKPEEDIQNAKRRIGKHLAVLAEDMEGGEAAGGEGGLSERMRSLRTNPHGASAVKTPHSQTAGPGWGSEPTPSGSYTTLSPHSRRKLENREKQMRRTAREPIGRHALGEDDVFLPGALTATLKGQVYFDEGRIGEARVGCVCGEGGERDEKPDWYKSLSAGNNLLTTTTAEAKQLAAARAEARNKAQKQQEQSLWGGAGLAQFSKSTSSLQTASGLSLDTPAHGSSQAAGMGGTSRVIRSPTHGVVRQQGTATQPDGMTTTTLKKGAMDDADEPPIRKTVYSAGRSYHDDAYGLSRQQRKKLRALPKPILANASMSFATRARLISAMSTSRSGKSTARSRRSGGLASARSMQSRRTPRQSAPGQRAAAATPSPSPSPGASPRSTAASDAAGGTGGSQVGAGGTGGGGGGGRAGINIREAIESYEAGKPADEMQGPGGQEGLVMTADQVETKGRYSVIYATVRTVWGWMAWDYQSPKLEFRVRVGNTAVALCHTEGRGGGRPPVVGVWRTIVFLMSCVPAPVVDRSPSYRAVSTS